MHAAIITAYRDYPSLARLVERLNRDFFRVYIHIDKRSTIGRAEIDELTAMGCDVTKIFMTRWGSFMHLHSVLFLIERALIHGDVDYVHVLSGHDYPLFDPEGFRDRCDGRIFIGHSKLADEDEHVRERYELRDPLYFLRGGPPGFDRLHKMLKPFVHFGQKLWGARRKQFGPYSTLYKGIVWSSFPAGAARRLLHDPDAQAFLNALRHTHIPEEVFFPTFFLNSDLAPLVVNDDLRFTDWKPRYGSTPAILDESDADAVLESGCLFARKMDSSISARLLDRIDAVRHGAAPVAAALNSPGWAA